MVLLGAAREAAVLVEKQHSLAHHASGTAVRVGRRVALVATAEVTAATARRPVSSRTAARQKHLRLSW